MSRIFRYGLVILALVLFIIAAKVFRLRPQYMGEVTEMPLKADTEVYFDDFGVPHIYAESAHDAYVALGYAHAQERLFQMELLRRAGGGELAEIFGQDLVPVDRFFRTLGTHRKALYEAQRMQDAGPTEFLMVAEAYLKGVNHFVEVGVSPLEFQLNGIEKRPWTLDDMFCVAGAMSFNFATGFKTDPWLQHVNDHWGPEYLTDLDIETPEGSTIIPAYPTPLADSVSAVPIEFGADVMGILMDHGINMLHGSNSWVIGPQNTEDGTTLFANDTHIGYAQPCTWYEAHLEYPGRHLYGNFMGGIPFALVGHNHKTAWGLTMWLNDDMDFYCEKLSMDSSQYEFEGQWRPLSMFIDTIRVKGEDPVVLTSRHSHHGPLVSEFVKFREKQDVLSLYWTFLDTDSELMEAFFDLNNAENMDQAREAVSLISAPGLNVSYADKQGNIALWAAGRLVKRPEHLRAAFVHDGHSGEDEMLGYHPWAYNPKLENPPWGFVHSANNQHASYDSTYYPGYYEPDYRAQRIGEKLAARRDWSVEAMKRLVMDDESPRQAHLAYDLVALLKDMQVDDWTDLEKRAMRSLKEWEGRHHVEDVGPMLYYHWVHHIMEQAMIDEVGQEGLSRFFETNLVKTAFHNIICNDKSAWWDNVSTTDVVETRNNIVLKAFRSSVSELEVEYGSDVEGWEWGLMHSTLHKHPFHEIPILGDMLSVGPFPSPGSIETVNNSVFWLDGTGSITASYGPQMRILIDMQDLQNSLSILPTGQSGVPVSPHYKDQSEMYIQGDFRPQHMDRKRIEAEGSQLTLRAASSNE